MHRKLDLPTYLSWEEQALVVAKAPRWDEAVAVLDIDMGAAGLRRRRVPFRAEARLALIEREVHRLLEEGGDV